MQFSRKTDYAFILLESLKPTFVSGEFLNLRAVAERESLPFAFLEKIAGRLKAKEIVDAKKGSGGGYRLLCDPRAISLKKIIDIFEEPPMMKCLRSPHPEKHCALVPLCPTRSKWTEIEKQVNKIFESTAIAEL